MSRRHPKLALCVPAFVLGCVLLLPFGSLSAQSAGGGVDVDASNPAAAEGSGDAAQPDTAQPNTTGEEAAPTIAPPVLVADVEAEYPELAFEHDVEADVVVQIDIGVDGTVSNIVPVELTYYTYRLDGSAEEDPRNIEEDTYGFIRPAVAAVAAYEFEPARYEGGEQDGEPVPVRVTWRVGFVIDYEEEVGPVVDGSGEGAPGEPAIDPDGPANFEGRLLTRGTREPLGTMRVTVTSVDTPTLSTSTLSGEGGEFAFNGLPPGTWQVRVEESGFLPFEVEETIRIGEATDATYFVERDTYGGYVSTSVAAAPRREVTRRTLAAQEIQRIPGNNNDAIRVVQNLPGVARSSFNGGEVIVRGSEPGDTGFYLDGMRLPAIYHFGGIRAVVPTELLDEIDFYPGGFPVEFGHATGGVINVTTRTDLPERTTGHVDVNVFDAGIFVSQPIGERFALDVGLRRSYIDVLLASVAEAIPLNFATAPRWYDYQVRATWEIDDRNTLRLLVLGSDDKVDFVLDDEEALEPENRGGIFARTYFHGATLAWESRISDTVVNRLRTQLQWQNTEFEFGQEAYFDLDNRLFSFRDEIEWTPSEQFGLRYGIDIERYPGDIQLRLPRPPKEGEEPVDFSQQEFIEGDEQFQVYWPAHYLALDIRPIESLQLLPGLRNEYYRGVDAWAFDPRLAIRWSATDRWVLKGSVSQHHQAPGFDEGSESFGNPDLELESAIHYVLGTEVQVLDHLSANVEFFYKDMNNLVARSDDTVERDGEVVAEVYDNDGIGRAYGAEFLLRHDLANNFFGWIAYTVSRSERRDPGDPRYRLFDFDQTHILTALGSYNLPKNWSIGARFRLVSGNPTTPIEGAVYDADTDVYARIPGETNSDRLPPFHQLDIRVDKRWIGDRWTANAYLDLQNIYNRANPETIQYNYDFTESERVTGLPIIPALGFRAEW